MGGLGIDIYACKGRGGAKSIKRKTSKKTTHRATHLCLNWSHIRICENAWMCIVQTWRPHPASLKDSVSLITSSFLGTLVVPFVHLHQHIPQERISASGISILNPKTYEMQPTLVFLPGKCHGQRSLVGYSPLRHKESDRTELLTPPSRHSVSPQKQHSERLQHPSGNAHPLGLYLCCFLSVLPSVKWLLGYPL